MSSVSQSVPGPVVRRLTEYLAYAQSACKEGVAFVSSHELATSLGLTPSTVRQDLSHVDFCGSSTHGYETEGLQRVLANFLGLDSEWRIVVVGAGNLGKALALHKDFRRQGFHICGLFDQDAGKMGQRIGRLTIRPVQELTRFARSKDADIGIIAVPAVSAQNVADALTAAGVRGILNLAPAHVTAGVPVIDARVLASLQELTRAIKSAGIKIRSPG